MTARNYALLSSVIFIIIAILQVLRALLGWPITVETGAGPFSVPLWLNWVAFIAFAVLGLVGLDAAGRLRDQASAS